MCVFSKNFSYKFLKTRRLILCINLLVFSNFRHEIFRKSIKRVLFTKLLYFCKQKLPFDKLRTVFKNNYIFSCSSGVAIQQSLQAFPDPQKHISSLPQHSPYFFPDPQLQVAISFSFCCSSMIVNAKCKYQNAK